MYVIASRSFILTDWHDAHYSWATTARQGQSNWAGCYAAENRRRFHKPPKLCYTFAAIYGRNIRHYSPEFNQFHFMQEDTVRVSCLQENLAKGLSIVGRAVSARSTLPVLGNILLEARDNQLRLAATEFRDQHQLLDRRPGRGRRIDHRAGPSAQRICQQFAA